MATLDQGWTVICPSDDEEDSSPPTKNETFSNQKLASKTDSAEINSSSDGTDDGDDDYFPEYTLPSSAYTPPIATWYDAANSHFVALHAKDPTKGSTLQEILAKDSHFSNSDSKEDDLDSQMTATTENKIRWKRWVSRKSGEIHDIPRNDEKKIFFQILRLRPKSSLSAQLTSQSPNVDEENAGTFDHDNLERDCLDADPAVGISLPIQMVHKSDNGENSSQESTQAFNYRAPMLAKFSPSQKYLVLQFSPTSVRIVPTNTSNSRVINHWTIDLERDAASPVLSKSYKMPTFSFKNTTSPIFSKEKAMLIGRIVNPSSRFSDPSLDPDITALLPGGVIWCQCRQTKGDQEDHKRHHDTEMLFLITNTGLLVYKVLPNQFNSKFVVSKYASIPFVVVSDESIINRNQAVAFWYDHKGKVLLVGSYCLPFERVKMCMRIRTYFLDTFLNQSFHHHLHSIGQISSQLFPSFLVGTEIAQLEQNQFIRPEDVSVNNVYGKSFCIELDTYSNKVTLHSLEALRINDKEHMKSIKYSPSGIDISRTKEDPGSTFVSVVDNLVIVHSRQSKQSLYLDVADADVNNYVVMDDSSYFSEEKEGNNHIKNIYNPSFSFLSPSLMLDPRGRGYVYHMCFDLKRFSDSVPWPRCKMTPFFLRRRSGKPESCHILLLQKVREFVQKNGEFSPEIDDFLDQVSNYYKKSSSAKEWDDEVCLPFIYKAALLPGTIEKLRLSSEETLKSSLNHVVLRVDENENSETDMELRSVLTQSEILEFVILPISYAAVANSDSARLRSALNFAISFVGALQQKSIEPCEALYCIIASLFWRLGDGVDIIGFLRSRKFHHHFESETQKKNYGMKASSEYLQYREDETHIADLKKSGMKAFAETLLMIAVEIPFGLSSKEKNKTHLQPPANLSEHNTPENTTNKKEAALHDSVLIYAVDLLCSVSSHRVAARHLLKIGRVIDAVSICSKVMFDETVTYHRLKANKLNPPPLKFADHGTMGEDFFKSTIKASSRMKDVGKRARLFHHVCKFLLRWDPESFECGRHNDPLTDKPRTRSLNSMSNVNKKIFKKAHSTMSSMETSSNKNKRRFSNHLHVIDENGPAESNLAKNVPGFPDDLLGGKDSQINIEVRKLYGYAIC